MLARCNAIHREVLRSRVFIALHMHAGDGNVHTNMPVNSDDYAMLRDANAAVARIMALARALGGVISGEHGIGITKLEYLTADELAPFARYKAKVDPEGRFNAGKLLAGADLANAYTPSFSLIGHESLILEASEIGGDRRLDQGLPALRQVQARLRDPRAAREPALFAAQQDPRRVAADRGIPVRGADAAGRVAAPFRRVLATSPTIARCATSACRRARSTSTSATSRSRCAICCARKGGSRSGPATAAAMFFLNATEPTTIKLAKRAMIGWGYGAQRARARRREAARDSCRARRSTRRRPSAPPTIRRRSSISSTSRCRAGCPSEPSRALLDIEDDAIVPIIRNPASGSEDSDAVFYFPGCGSERLFSQVGLATQAMLWHVGAQTVLPPGYLCCGYPQTAAGDHDRGQRIITDNRVLFHRVANTLNYLDIKTVIVSCGTCMDQLQKYEFAKIFPGCRLLDIHEYLLEKGVALDGVDGRPVHVSRSLPHADEDLRAARGRQRPHGGAGRAERALLRRIRDARHDASRHLDAGPLPQGSRNEEGRGCAARRRFRGRGQGADLVPVVPAGAVALRRRRGRPPPTTSSSRSRGACSAPTGWPITSPTRTAAGSSACCV